jgi:hypothetical protein
MALRRIGLPEEDIGRFLPPDISGILKEMKEGNKGLFCREVTLKSCIFSEQISLTPDAGTVWIYITESGGQGEDL